MAGAAAEGAVSAAAAEAGRSGEEGGGSDTGGLLPRDRQERRVLLGRPGRRSRARRHLAERRVRSHDHHVRVSCVSCLLLFTLQTHL